MIGTRAKSGKRVSASQRDLVEQVLYHKGSDGKYDVTLTDYWDRVVCKTNPFYTRYRFSQGARRVVCPFHDDLAPSLGLIIDKETGVEVYNCFGCGVSGTVVTFHEKFFKENGLMKGGSSVNYLMKLASIYGVKLETEKIEVAKGRAPEIDFGKNLSYSPNIHKENVMTLKENVNSIPLSVIQSNWDLITQKIIDIKKG